MTASTPNLRKMDVQEFLRRAESGAFSGYRVELLDGWVTDGKRHTAQTACAACMIDKWFLRRLPDGLLSWIRGLLEFGRSCPQPDHAVVRGEPHTFPERFPNAAETLLVIESSGETLDFDRNSKGPIYARSRVPEYWIVNCKDRQIEVYTDPLSTSKSPRYRKLTTYLPGESIPVHVAGKKLGELAVKELFPPKK